MEYFKRYAYTLSETEKYHEKFLITWRFIVCLLLIPILFVIGFVFGILLLRNPLECAFGLISQNV